MRKFAHEARLGLLSCLGMAPPWVVYGMVLVVCSARLATSSLNLRRRPCVCMGRHRDEWYNARDLCGRRATKWGARPTARRAGSIEHMAGDGRAGGPMAGRRAAGRVGARNACGEHFLLAETLAAPPPAARRRRQRRLVGLYSVLATMFPPPPAAQWPAPAVHHAFRGGWGPAHRPDAPLAGLYCLLAETLAAGGRLRRARLRCRRAGSARRAALRQRSGASRPSVRSPDCPGARQGRSRARESARVSQADRSASGVADAPRHIRPGVVREFTRTLAPRRQLEAPPLISLCRR